MKSLLVGYLILIALISCQKPGPKRNFRYPISPKIDHEDEYFGVMVSDPYRWMEEEGSDAIENWILEQNSLTKGYLSDIPFRDNIRQRLKDLWDYERYSAPFKEGSYYYYSKNDGLQNQSVWYRQKDLGEEATLFLDPNSFSQDGTISLASTSFSKDGKFFAYSTSESGSDWRTIYVMDTETLEHTQDTIYWAKFSGIAWKGNGFFYSSYDKPTAGQEHSSFNYQHKIYYHTLGTPQAKDALIFGGEKQPVRYAFSTVSEDERFLVIFAAERTNGNAVYLRDFAQDNGDLIPVVQNFEHNYSFVGTVGGKVLLKTDYQAPNGQLILVDPANPNPENWQNFIEEKEHVLNSATTGGGKLFVTYLEDASSHVYQYSLDGTLDHKIDLPTLGTAVGFGGKKNDPHVFYTFTSFTYPPTIYRYDISQGSSTLFRHADVKFDPEAFETHQVFFSSKDGTQVPMFIVHKRGLEYDGSNPTYLYGYGGFNISLRPSFSISRILWLEQGGIFAMPNLRGGGEYGQEWHDAGTKFNKQNVFDDFISAAEYLIQEKYTSSEKLAIFGGSNGGLLVGASLTQRPDLFQVAVPSVGVLDMLRYHKFTAGAGWIYDYGCADSSKAMFEYLKGYSPLHNVRPGIQYPAILVKTADHDDRVVPAHSFKFIAELQDKQDGENPALIRVETKAGHGAGKPTSKILDELADTYAFTFYNLGEEFTYNPKEGEGIPQKYK